VQTLPNGAMHDKNAVMKVLKSSKAIFGGATWSWSNVVWLCQWHDDGVCYVEKKIDND